MPLSSDEAEYLLKEILAEEQRRMQLLMKPYVSALVEIETRKPPRSVALSDGRFMTYVGPTAEDIAGPYKAPAWLEEMCRDDMRIGDILRRYRQQT